MLKRASYLPPDDSLRDLTSKHYEQLLGALRVDSRVPISFRPFASMTISEFVDAMHQRTTWLTGIVHPEDRSLVAGFASIYGFDAFEGTGRISAYVVPASRLVTSVQLSLMLFIQRCFEDLPALRKLYADVTSDSAKNIGLTLSQFMTLEATIPHATESEGLPLDLYIHGLLREEWATYMAQDRQLGRLKAAILEPDPA